MILDRLPGPLVLLILLLTPGLIVALVLHSAIWIFYVAAGIVMVMLLIAAFPIPRKVTPTEFADELERHLLGTEGPYDWDDV